MSRLDPSLYSEKWMKAVLEDARTVLDTTRFQSDVLPAMWTDTALGAPKQGEVVNFAFQPGYIVTIKCGYRTLIYHTNNKEAYRLVSDETKEPEPDEDDPLEHKCNGSCNH